MEKRPSTGRSSEEPVTKTQSLSELVVSRAREQGKKARLKDPERDARRLRLVSGLRERASVFRQLLLNDYLEFSRFFFHSRRSACGWLSSRVKPAAEEPRFFFAELSLIHGDHEPSRSDLPAPWVSLGVNSHQHVSILRRPVGALVIVFSVRVQNSALLIEQKLIVLFHSVRIDVHQVRPIR